jgi:hypothetical protein
LYPHAGCWVLTGILTIMSLFFFCQNTLVLLDLEGTNVFYENKAKLWSR